MAHRAGSELARRLRELGSITALFTVSALTTPSTGTRKYAPGRGELTTMIFVVIAGVYTGYALLLLNSPLSQRLIAISGWSRSWAVLRRLGMVPRMLSVAVHRDEPVRNVDL